MPLAPGSTVPPVVRDLVATRGLHATALLVVVKEGCPACEDTLPRLDAARVPGVLVVAQEDAAGTAALAASLGPALSWAPDAAPYPVSRALEVQFTPMLMLLENGQVRDTAEGFDPDAMHRMLAALGSPPFQLFAPGEARPRFRPG